MIPYGICQRPCTDDMAFKTISAVMRDCWAKPAQDYCGHPEYDTSDPSLCSGDMTDIADQSLK